MGNFQWTGFVIVRGSQVRLCESESCRFFNEHLALKGRIMRLVEWVLDPVSHSCLPSTGGYLWCLIPLQDEGGWVLSIRPRLQTLPSHSLWPFCIHNCFAHQNPNFLSLGLAQWGVSKSRTIPELGVLPLLIVVYFLRQATEASVLSHLWSEAKQSGEDFSLHWRACLGTCGWTGSIFPFPVHQNMPQGPGVRQYASMKEEWGWFLLWANALRAFHLASWNSRNLSHRKKIRDTDNICVDDIACIS